jgi:hypothetical protein
MSPEVQTALDECLAAFAANQDAKSAWCCHHEKLWEVLTEPYEKRIAYILIEKPKSEHLLRFRNFRPCSQHDTVKPLQDAYNAQVNSLQDAYDAQVKPLQDAYNAQVKPLQDAYNAQVKPLRDACNAQVNSLRDACNAQVKSLYQADVPKGTWNGTSIFPNK